MMTVHEVSKISGVSIRALHHYHNIGLLPATEVTEAGYRLYDDTALERLHHILLFKELEFSLKEIKDILDSPDFDRNRALEQQIHLLDSVSFTVSRFSFCFHELSIDESGVLKSPTIIV